jgi:hypothetical protein
METGRWHVRGTHSPIKAIFGDALDVSVMKIPERMFERLKELFAAATLSLPTLAECGYSRARIASVASRR